MIDPSASKFVVVTGCNGVGKSTFARGLAEVLPASLLRYSEAFQRFRREASLDTDVGPRARLLYYLAATVELSVEVGAGLTDGHVVCDRYLESPVSLVLVESDLTSTDVDELRRPFDAWLRSPDLTVLLTASYRAACARIRKRWASSGFLTRVQKRTLQSEEFFQRREAALREEAARLGPLFEMNTTTVDEEEMRFAAAEMACRITSTGQGLAG